MIRPPGPVGSPRRYAPAVGLASSPEAANPWEQRRHFMVGCIRTNSWPHHHVQPTDLYIYIFQPNRQNGPQAPYQHKRLCMRELVLDDLNYGQDAVADLLRIVTMIVSAHPQHHDLENQQNTNRIYFRILWMIQSCVYSTINQTSNNHHIILIHIFNNDKDLWADIIQFTIAQSPEHMLSCITTHTEI